MFFYIYKNLTTFYSGFTVKEDTVTLHPRDDIKTAGFQLGLTSEIAGLRQCTPCDKSFLGLPLPRYYTFLNSGTQEHELRSLHPDDGTLPSELVRNISDEHRHLSSCDIVTPEHLDCLLSQIAELEPSIVGDLRRLVDSYRIESGLKSLALKLKLDLKSLGVKVKNDFDLNLIPPEEQQTAVESYKAYFDTHKDEIERSYRALQARLNDSSWLYELYKLWETASNAMTKSILPTALSSLIEEVLHSKFSGKTAAVLSDIATVGIFAYAYSSSSPFIVTTLLLGLIKHCGYLSSEQAFVASTSIGIALLAITENLPKSPLQMTVAFLGSAASISITKMAVHHVYHTVSSRLGFFKEPPSRGGTKGTQDKVDAAAINDSTEENIGKLKVQ